MGVALAIGRLVLAGVFAFAGIAKLRDPTGTRQNLIDFGMPASLARVSAYLLPAAELAVALALVPPPTAFVGALGAMALLSLFILAIAGNLLLGRRPDCNCFGQRRATAISQRTLVRNGVLWALAGSLVLAGPADQGHAAAGWIAGPSSGVLVGAGAALLGIGLLAAQCLLLLRIARQNAEILKHLTTAAAPAGAVTASRSESVDSGAQTIASALSGLKPGTPAPDFSLKNLRDETVTLASLRSPDKPLVLVFADAACGPCRALLPDLALWQEHHPGAFDLAVITRGTADANREKFGALAPARVLLQEQREVAKAYRALGTPSAVVVLPDGTIGRPLANAEGETRALIWQLVEPGTLEPTPPTAPAFTLPGLDGTDVRSDDLRGHATILFFYGRGCGLCRQLLPELKAWEAQPGSDRVRLLVVSSAGPDESRALGLSPTVVLDPDSSLRKRYGALGTPSAALVDSAGYIVRRTAGRTGVQRLIGRPAGSLDQAEAAPLKDSCVEDELLSDGSMVLYNGCRRKMLTLNGTAALIWECCDGSHTVDEIAAEIRDVFPAGHEIERGVRDVLEGLLRDGMIVVGPLAGRAPPSRRSDGDVSVKRPIDRQTEPR